MVLCAALPTITSQSFSQSSSFASIAAFGAGFLDGAISDVNFILDRAEIFVRYGWIGLVINEAIQDFKTAKAVYEALPEIQNFLSNPITNAKNAYDALSSEDKAYIAGQITEKAVVIYASAKALGSLKKASRGGTNSTKWQRNL